MDVLRRRHTGRLRQRHRANRPDSDRLASIVAATPALRERAVSKEARLVATITDLLVGRGASACYMPSGLVGIFPSKSPGNLLAHEVLRGLFGKQPLAKSGCGMDF
jgi:hypothetical protein